MSQSKKVIRNLLKEYRGRYLESAWNDLSVDIQKNALKLIEKLCPSSVGIYVESIKGREVATDLIIAKLFESKRTILIPRVTQEEGVMDFTVINSDSKLILNSWGIPENIDDDATFDTPDVIIVPMLGGDTHGYRIGYGKGYYDRYLSGKKMIKIGLCPSTCVLHELPSDKLDVKLNYIITEAEILRTNA